MKLTVLGSGCSTPHPLRGSSGYWVESGSGSIMLDFSASSIDAMAKSGLDWANLDAIWISHFHLDHIGGLAPFLFAAKYAEVMQDRKKPLKIFGAKGLRSLLKKFDAANDYDLFSQPFPMEIIEIKALEPFNILAGIEAVTFSTPHTEESHAIRLGDKNGKSIVFTSDTGFTKNLALFAKDCDLFICECSFFKDKPTPKHLEFAEAIYLGMHSKAQRLLLTHFYPEFDSIDIAEEAKKFAPKFEVIEAKDGLIIEI